MRAGATMSRKPLKDDHDHDSDGADEDDARSVLRRESGLGTCGLFSMLTSTFFLLALGVGGLLMRAFDPDQLLSQTSALALTWEKTMENDGAWRARPVTASGRQLTWGSALSALVAGKLGPELTTVLRESPHLEPAFFWETPPVTAATAAEKPFEMVTLPAPQLNVHADPGPFDEYFSTCEGRAATAFASLGRDAMLVAPCPLAGVDSAATYASLSHFLRRAPAEQVQAFWVEVGKVMQSRLETQRDHPTWLSTEGSGVNYLHVRLDSRPKYYHHTVYARSG
jgi:hypothetical protein